MEREETCVVHCLSSSFTQIYPIRVILLRKCLLPPQKLNNLFQYFDCQFDNLFHLVSVVNVANSRYDRYHESSGSANDLYWFDNDKESNGTSDEPSPATHPSRKDGGKYCFLKMKLTDGQNVVHAIQYGGVQFLDEKAPSGTKILLISRVLLRRGILLLNSSNCQVLGGDFESVLHFRDCDGETLSNGVLRQLPSSKERLESKTDPRQPTQFPKTISNLSTNSHYPIRMQRIPNELLQNTHTEVPLENEPEKLSIGRPAVVPSLQSVATTTAHVHHIDSRKSHHGDSCEASLLDGTTYHRSLEQLRQKIIPRNSCKSGKEDLSSSICDSIFIAEDSKSSRYSSLRGNFNTTGNRSITDYFQVSRSNLKEITSAKNKRIGSSSIKSSGEQNCSVMLPNKIGPGAVKAMATHASSIMGINRCDGSTVHDDSYLISSIGDFSDDLYPTQKDLLSRNITQRTQPSTAVVTYKRSHLSEGKVTGSNTTAGWISCNERLFHTSSFFRPSIMDKLMDFKITLLADVLAKRKFWMLPKVVNVMGVCSMRGDLTAKHGSWLLYVDIADESMDSQRCVVSSQLLERLLGFSVRQCEKFSRQNNTHELLLCKERAIEVMKNIQRLDLIFSMEVHSQKEKLPSLVKILSLYEALGA
ncbi:hypothetical protein RB195_007336 [Necator americanus]|uniref:RecQ-mediated genome instability protein 1 n=1 Tax=Necator americanus TaxID=51031 RepID=A0ABR1BWS0_NECAM